MFALPAAARRCASVGQPPVRLGRRMMLLAVGPLVLAAGAAASIAASARIGAGSFQALEAGLIHASGWPVTLVVYVEAAAALGIGMLLGARPRMAALYMLVALGPVVGGLLPLMPVPTSTGAAVTLAVAGATAIGVGVGAYLAAGFGASPHDLPLAALRARGFSPTVAKAAVDVALVAAGWLLGVRPGVGAIVPVVVVGPVLTAVLARTERWAGTAAASSDVAVAGTAGPGTVGSYPPARDRDAAA